MKTGAAGISDLVRQVAVLPPLLTVLRGGAGMGGAARSGAGMAQGISAISAISARPGANINSTRSVGSMVGAAVVAALGVAMGATMGSALAAR